MALKISQPHSRIELSIKGLDLPFCASLTNTSTILLCLFDFGNGNTLDLKSWRGKYVTEGYGVAGGPGVEEFEGHAWLGLFASEVGFF